MRLEVNLNRFQISLRGKISLSSLGEVKLTSVQISLPSN